MKHLVIGQRQKPPNFSAFHWSPHGSLVSIGQNFVTTREVHLPKRTETSLITESDQSGPNHQLLQLCTARTAWSDSDQAVWAVHSCISWFHIKRSLFKDPLYMCMHSSRNHEAGLNQRLSFFFVCLPGEHTSPNVCDKNYTITAEIINNLHGTVGSSQL